MHISFCNVVSGKQDAIFSERDGKEGRKDRGREGGRGGEGKKKEDKGRVGSTYSYIR